METDICLHTLIRKVSLNQLPENFFLELEEVKSKRWALHIYLNIKVW